MNEARVVPDGKRWRVEVRWQGVWYLLGTYTAKKWAYDYAHAWDTPDHRLLECLPRSSSPSSSSQ